LYGQFRRGRVADTALRGANPCTGRNGNLPGEKRRNGRSSCRKPPRQSCALSADEWRARISAARKSWRPTAPSLKATDPPSQSLTQKPTSPGHRQPLTAFETHNGRSTFAAGTALHAPLRPLNTAYPIGSVSGMGENVPGQSIPRSKLAQPPKNVTAIWSGSHASA
jgi:hypothetical protein